VIRIVQLLPAHFRAKLECVITSYVSNKVG
jgi:hypothetical protein